MREKYVDTLAKLYDYATTVYAKKQYTQWYDTQEGGDAHGSPCSCNFKREKGKRNQEIQQKQRKLFAGSGAFGYGCGGSTQ